jgi:pyruvate formate lyase activating enzyme
MTIGGLQKFSLLDYPGQLAAIVFVQGCNFRCPFCYNPALVSGQGDDHVLTREDDFFDWLFNRIGKLDAVVITGGEPGLHDDLPDFAGKIKGLGFKVKIDTNGAFPGMLLRLTKGELVDYFAMDIKGPAGKYEHLTGIRPDLAKIEKSIKIIRGSGLPYEFRTTIVPGWHEREDIEKTGGLIRGADKWFLQSFKSDVELINRDLERIKPYSRRKMNELREIGRKFVTQCEVR